jgi:hypothetical protein
MSVTSPIQPGGESTDWAEVWIVTEPEAILIMESPYQGNFIYFPLKKVHFFAPPLLFPTSLRNSWVSHGIRNDVVRSCFYVAQNDVSRNAPNTIELSIYKRTNQPFFLRKKTVEMQKRQLLEASDAAYIPWAEAQCCSNACSIER